VRVAVADAGGRVLGVNCVDAWSHSNFVRELAKIVKAKRVNAVIL
jgi:hypothetical protein